MAPGGANDIPEPSRLAPAAILEGLPDAVVVAKRDGSIAFVNALAQDLFGYSRQELIGRSVQVLWPTRLRQRYTRNMELYFATEHPIRFSTEVWGLRKDGSEFAGEMSWGVVRTQDGPLLLAVGRDVSERHAAEVRLRALAGLAERALGGTDAAALTRDALDVMRSVLPVTAAQVRLRDAGPVVSRGAIEDAGVRMSLADGDELMVAPAREFDQEEMRLLHALANILSTALVRLRDEERTRHEAVHDPLTGLANRTLLNDRLQHALARSAREGDVTGVLFVDLDNFKQINDAYGHAAGDAVLMELGSRLQTAVRPGDTIARLGGDEFVVICEGIDEGSAVAVGRRLQEAISLPIDAAGTRHRLTASIGIALGRSDATVLLGQADAAAYRAKAGGRGSVTVFA